MRLALRRHSDGPDQETGCSVIYIR